MVAAADTLFDEELVGMPARAPARGAANRRLAHMFAAHFDFVWRAVRRFGVPDAHAEDAAQEVFMVVSRKLDRIEVGKEKSFLFGTAMRVASDARRKLSRQRDQGDDELVQRTASTAPAQDALIDRKRARKALQDMIDAMPDDQRSVFVLFELEAMTASAISELLDIPPGTVASRLRRARTTFRAAVDKLHAEGQGNDG